MWATTFGTILTFFITFITIGDCEKPKKPAEIPQSYWKEQPNLSDFDFLIDYFRLDKIRLEIIEYFGSDDLRFLGQSLAYVGQIMIIRDQIVAPSTSRSISLVPFSGNFFRIKSEDVNPLDLNQHTMKLGNLPTEEELENFKDFLRGVGLDPRSIIERYKKTGRRTVIIKKVKDCINLMSFLSIIFDWARIEKIRPSQLSHALKVFVVTMNGFAPSEIVDREFRVEIYSMSIESRDEINTVERTAYPERYNYYARLVPNYPPQNWNEPPSEFDVEHEHRRRLIIERITDIVQTIAVELGVRDTTSSTLVLRNPSGINGACRFNQNRSKRDLSAYSLKIKQLYLIWTLNKDVLETLEMEHVKSSNEKSFDELFEDQLNDSSSSVSKTLSQACDRFYNTWYRYSNAEETALSEEVRISQVSFEKIKTTDYLDHDFVDSYPKFSVDFDENFEIETTTEAVFHCSEERNESILECPVNDVQYLGQIMYSLFDVPFKKIVPLPCKLVD